DMPVPASLAHRFSDELDTLLALRVRLDAVITALAAGLSDEDLARPITYRHARGESRKPFRSPLLHFFNHPTHHRGQVTTLLSQAGVDIGVTDLLEWIPEHG